MYLEVIQISQKRELKPFFHRDTAFPHLQQSYSSHVIPQHSCFDMLLQEFTGFCNTIENRKLGYQGNVQIIVCLRMQCSVKYSSCLAYSINSRWGLCGS